MSFEIQPHPTPVFYQATQPLFDVHFDVQKNRLSFETDDGTKIVNGVIEDRIFESYSDGGIACKSAVIKKSVFAAIFTLDDQAKKITKHALYVLNFSSGQDKEFFQGLQFSPSQLLLDAQTLVVGNDHQQIRFTLTEEGSSPLAPQCEKITFGV
jgi:hypothetical protein